jgi:uncharacterized DUF497 family protein
MDKFKFQSPAVYKIKVDGVINENWSEKLGGMQITVLQSKDTNPSTVLIGRINDQSALSGVLNTLYENHVSIISVKKLEDEEQDF